MIRLLKITTALAALCSSLFLTGCVVGRRTVDLPVTQLGGTAPSKGSIYVGEIADARHFENKPKDASTPSIDGDVNAVGKEQLGTMIGRQRNTYGKAMGDIALPAGDSVAKRARALVEEGLRRHGYAIATDAATPNTATVQIDEFWAWFTPGMWTISFESNISCKLTITKDGVAKTFTVRGYAINKGQVASDANWQLAYRKAFDDFLEKLVVELKKNDL